MNRSNAINSQRGTSKNRIISLGESVLSEERINDISINKDYYA